VLTHGRDDGSGAGIYRASNSAQSLPIAAALYQHRPTEKHRTAVLDQSENLQKESQAGT